MRYETMKEACAYLDQIPSFTKKTPLSNTGILIRKLGLSGVRQRIIHVAGTNGKGSVCAYLDSILRKSGF